MKIIVSHPTSNQVNRAMLKGLYKANQLQSFYTSVATFPNDSLDRLSGLKPFSELKKRQFASELQNMTHTYPYKELMRMVLPKIGMNSFTAEEKSKFSIYSAYQYFDKMVAKQLLIEQNKGATALYAYEDGAYHSFLRAKELGVKCMYDQPIGYWRVAHRILQKERELWPEWEATIPGLNDSEEKLLNKDNELQLADCVFAASTFTANSLKEYPGELKQIKVIPFGFPEIKTNKQFKNISPNSKIRLLFVGGLSQRKGIANLFTAVNKFKNQIELTIVGRKLNENCEVLNKELKKHNYISSLPFQKVLELMGQNDVFVFPSLFEGFGMVITEAMSQGLPVITTINTAGGDLIEHGKNGWLVQPGDTDGLIDMLQELIQNPEQITVVAKEAIKTAEARPWFKYSKEVANTLTKLK
ncbi:glycosyltransferase family 4 protein [Maribacter dokdonensis]|uniref:glycosyltransferase family 4 protein n=1 Tax=Maribacter dokdonensis TaxID=320912 RepID=UPI0007199C4F|nr:glycosyltransferase family 4 protein [Maribacter dokdonensis]KSA15219.1 Glycosyl transferase group 1 [Maribacter dokdonensis DSW-8]